MRNIEDIEKDLAAAREALSSVEGTQAEVYSRIVGYYRSVRNWNRGKREEYGERRQYLVPDFKMPGAFHAAAPSPSFPQHEMRLLLFIRSSCPGCTPAKAAAGRLGIPVDLVNADTPEGMAEAVKRNVFSTPTAILLAAGGRELKRAADADTIGSLNVSAEPIAV